MILETTRYAHGLLWHLEIEFDYDGELVELTGITTLGYYPDDHSEVRIPVRIKGDPELLNTADYDDIADECERHALRVLA